MLISQKVKTTTLKSLNTLEEWHTNVDIKHLITELKSMAHLQQLASVFTFLTTPIIYVIAPPSPEAGSRLFSANSLSL